MALTWRWCGATVAATSAQGRRRLGHKLAGATLHGDGSECYQQREEVVASLMRTERSPEAAAFAGGEERGGGEDGAAAATVLRRSPGEASARTGCAVTRRCRWWGRGGRSGDGGAGIGEEGACGRRRGNANSGEAAVREGERVVAASCGGEGLACAPFYRGGGAPSEEIRGAGLTAAMARSGGFARGGGGNGREGRRRDQGTLMRATA